MSDPTPIAILMDHISDYQAQLLAGMQAALRERGLSSVTYVGRGISHRDLEDGVLGVYGLLDPANHSGLLVSAASISGQFEQEDMQRLLEHYRPLPVVCAGAQVTPYPSIRVEHRTGMNQLMHHLIHERGFTRFVFVAGIEGNPDAQIREQVLLEHLEKQGLGLRHHLRGNFFTPTAREEMQKLLDQTRDFQVVVCANDEMAFGVTEVLQEAGLQVGQDVFVTGFDDVPYAGYAHPPLTTVRQPIQEMGQKAVHCLLRESKEETFPENLTLETELVVRESSGGSPWFSVEKRESQSLDLLGNSLKVALQQKDPALFLTAWDRWLQEEVSTRESGSGVTQMVLELQAALLPQVQQDDLSLLLSYLHHAHQQATRKAHLELSRQYHHLRVRQRLTSRMELPLSSPSSLEDLKRPLQEYLQHHGISRYALVLYEDPGPVPGQQGRVWLSGGLPAACPESFPPRNLLPQCIHHELNRGQWMVMPLEVQQHDGLLLFEVQDVQQVEHIRQAISSAIHQAMLREQQQHYTDRLERQVQARTRELEQEVQVRCNAEKTLQLLNQQLQVTPVTDALTGLYNRAALDTYLHREWQRHTLSGQPIGVLLCDIDFFKQYNDTYGHLQGDRCLQHIARALEGSGRTQSDFLFRYGGEEFLLILPGTDHHGAELVAERLVSTVRALQLEHRASGVADHVTLSVGAASTIPNGSIHAEDLIHRADQALYQAKHSGRNRAVVVKKQPDRNPQG